MFNMFVVALVPFKSHCYLKKFYFTADTATSKPEGDLLDLISRNSDIVYTHFALHLLDLRVSIWM